MPSEGELEGRTAFITGGSMGLGRAIAVCLAGYGANVVAAARSDGIYETVELVAEETGDEDRAIAIECDVSDEASVESAIDETVETFGGLDVLVNNAGVAAAGRIERIPREDWEWILDINLMGVVRGCRVFVPLLKQQGHGHIVNVASMAGLLNVPVMSSYNVTKAGVVALSETLRFELEPWGIRTSLVCPSFFRTNLQESLRTPEPGMAETVDKLLAGSDIDADDIAVMIRDAVDRGRFLVLPHRHGRRAWFFKRHLPWLYNRGMRKLAARYRRKLEESDE